MDYYIRITANCGNYSHITGNYLFLHDKLFSCINISIIKNQYIVFVEYHTPNDPYEPIACDNYQQLQ